MALRSALSYFPPSFLGTVITQNRDCPGTWKTWMKGKSLSVSICLEKRPTLKLALVLRESVSLTWSLSFQEYLEQHSGFWSGWSGVGSLRNVSAVFSVSNHTFMAPFLQALVPQGLTLISWNERCPPKSFPRLKSSRLLWSDPALPVSSIIPSTWPSFSPDPPLIQVSFSAKWPPSALWKWFKPSVTF